MIGKVIRGKSIHGLVGYLFAPGKAEEHHNPRVVASWLGDAAKDLDPKDLAALLYAPVTTVGRDPGDRWTWHTPMRAAPEDRTLTDDEWAQIASKVADEVGLAANSEGAACPWVAVRHADDHIHIAAVLVREDGTKFEPRHDYAAVARARHWAEQTFGLRPTGPTDGTGPKRPTRAETEKAARQGRPVEARVALRREVRLALAGARSRAEFAQALHDAGVAVRWRESTINEGEITGYAVGWPGDTTAQGDQVWFGGSKLAKDLSWSKLQARWGHSGAAGDPWMAAMDAAKAAQVELAAGDPGNVDGIADAVGDVLDAAAAVEDGRSDGTWLTTAELFDRARRSPDPKVYSDASFALRRAARALGSRGRRRHEREVARLAAELSTLLLRLAEARRADRTAAAAAAASAARRLQAAAGSPSTGKSGNPLRHRHPSRPWTR